MKLTSELAAASVDDIKAQLAGSTLTIYSVARPHSADDAVDRSIALATFTFASPAFDGETPRFVAGSVPASSVGTPGFGRARKPDGATIADFSAGPGDREIKFSEVSFSQGAPVTITAFTIKPEASWPERPDYYDTRPRDGYPMPAA
ncbi:MAG: hypothetical protein P4M07_11850 [Xanthobacteraceae bacterium]|nr:hypothetical protein [Xanthobacteraceae bacterium]